MSDTKLVRLPSKGILGGACAGLGANLRVNPASIRVLFILFISAGGVGTIAYFALWLLLATGVEQQDLIWDRRMSQYAEELTERMRDLGLQISRGFEGSHPQLPCTSAARRLSWGSSYSVKPRIFPGCRGCSWSSLGHPCSSQPA